MDKDSQLIYESFEPSELLKDVRKNINMYSLYQAGMGVVAAIIEGNHYDDVRVGASCTSGQVRAVKGFYTSDIVLDDLFVKIAGDSVMHLAHRLHLKPLSITTKILREIETHIRSTIDHTVPLVREAAIKQYGTKDMDPEAVARLAKDIDNDRYEITGHSYHDFEPDFSKN